MDLRSLRHFVTLAQRRSFVAAAEALHLTQPALSRSIRALEEEVGLTLIERHRSGCSVTAAGALLLRDAAAILAQAAALRHNLQAHARGDLGHLRFGAAPLPAALLLPQLFAAAAGALPGLTLAASLGPVPALVAELRRDGIEFFVCAETQLPRDAALAVSPLGHAPLSWIVRAGHPLAGRAPLTIDELRDFPWACVGADFGATREGEPDLLLGKPIAIRCDDYALLLDTTRRCDAVCLSSSALLTPGDGLAALRPDLGGFPETIALVLVQRAGRPASATAAALLAIVTEVARAIALRR